MPHEIKLEGSPGCPQITPLTVPDGQFATVENISGGPLGFLRALNGAPEQIGAGSQEIFTESVFLVSTGSTDIRLAFAEVSAPLSPDTLPAPVEPVSDPVEPVAAPADPAPAPVTETPQQPADAPVEATVAQEPAAPAGGV